MEKRRFESKVALVTGGSSGIGRSALYAAAKAGVLGLTKSAALEYAAQGIRVNALVAGGFRTPMLEGVFAKMSPKTPRPWRRASRSWFRLAGSAGRRRRRTRCCGSAPKPPRT